MDIVKLMIEKDIDDWNGGLEGACDGGYINIVNLMIEKGANDWDRGLYYACQGGHYEIIQLLNRYSNNPININLEPEIIYLLHKSEIRKFKSIDKLKKFKYIIKVFELLNFYEPSINKLIINYGQ
jgi:hypothetical protein